MAKFEKGHIPWNTGLLLSRKTSCVKAYANNKVHTELDAGRLKRPDFCQRCGCLPGVDKIGKIKLHAHHPDHTKPLEVEWLCVSCHLKEDIPCGEKHHYAKLTLAQAKEVFILREQGWSLVAMAHLFNVSPQTPGRILSGQSWRRALEEDNGSLRKM